MNEQTTNEHVKNKQDEVSKKILELLLSAIEEKARKETSFPDLVKFFEKMTPAEMCAIVLITTAKP